MASFTDTFPDSAVLAVLGDDITHIKSGGGTELFKGEFEMKYLEEELGDQIDIIYPVVELNNSDAASVTNRSKIKVGPTTYRVLKKRPINVGKTQVILRSN